MSLLDYWIGQAWPWVTVGLVLFFNRRRIAKYLSD